MSDHTRIKSQPGLSTSQFAKPRSREGGLEISHVGFLTRLVGLSIHLRYMLKPIVQKVNMTDGWRLELKLQCIRNDNNAKRKQSNKKPSLGPRHDSSYYQKCSDLIKMLLQCKDFKAEKVHFYSEIWKMIAVLHYGGQLLGSVEKQFGVKNYQVLKGKKHMIKKICKNASFRIT